MEISEDAATAVVQCLRQHAQRAQIGVREHADLASALAQAIELEYVNGMEWGFYDQEQSRDISYSVSLPSTPLGLAILMQSSHGHFSLVTGCW